MLDRRVGEHPLDVALAREEERRDHDRRDAEAHHELARERRAERAVGEHLAAHERVERDVEQQPREHRRHRRGALGVRVGQPVVERHQPDLRPVADEQEHERDRQHRRLELRAHAGEVRPEQRVDAAAEQLLRGHVEQDRAEQRLRDPDAAQDEVLPRRLEARRRPVEADEQHRRERRRLERDPQDAHVVREQHQQHREHEQLVHAVIEAQPRGVEPAVVLLDPHVRPREHRRRHRDEGGQRDQEHVQRVDEELLLEREDRPGADDARGERAGRDERRDRERDVQLRRPAPVAGSRERGPACKRDPEDGEDLPVHRLILPSASRGGGCRASRTARGSGRRTRRG